MRIIFWGTPRAAVPFLERLLMQEQVVAVVTRADKPAGRGQELHPSPVKALALAKNLPVLQPTALKDPAFLAQLENLKADAGIVVAYGKILPLEVIRLFPAGLYNLHFSLLPHLRGAAPIQWALLRGDAKTGVTAFRIAEGLDTGVILAQQSLEIAPDDTAVSLEGRLVTLGISVLEETLKKVKAGDAGRPQTGEVTLAPPIKKEQAAIDWSKSAEEIARQVRGLARLGCHARQPSGKLLKILRAEPFPGRPPDGLPALGEPPFDSLGAGAFCGVGRGRGFLIKCGLGVLLVTQVQAEGKKETDAWPFLQGARLKIGDRFS